MAYRSRHVEELEGRQLLTAEFVELRTFGLVERFPVVSSGEATVAVLGDFNKDGTQDLAFGSSQRRGLLDERNSVVGIALGDQELFFVWGQSSRLMTMSLRSLLRT